MPYIASPERYGREQGEIEGARVVRIGGAAHLPSLERPQEFNQLVLEFLGESR